MKAIVELLKSSGNIISLNGDWGSGKTYSWYNADNPDTTIRGQLEKCGKKTIYVSLFGKQSVSELKKEILNKSIEILNLLALGIIFFIISGIYEIWKALFRA